MDRKHSAKQQRGCQPLQEDAKARKCSTAHSSAEPLQEDEVYECGVLIEEYGPKQNGKNVLLK
jgi:hypothetical protein